jgi:hypothetical protein
MHPAFRSPAPIPAFTRVPNHPHAIYRTWHDRMGQFWVECACSVCGPGGNWKKPCNQPHLWSTRVFEYARQHGHGVRPRR